MKKGFMMAMEVVDSGWIFFCLHKSGLIMRIAIASAVDKSRFLTSLEYLLSYTDFVFMPQ